MNKKKKKTHIFNQLVLAIIFTQCDDVFPNYRVFFSSNIDIFGISVSFMWCLISEQYMIGLWHSWKEYEIIDCRR